MQSQPAFELGGTLDLGDLTRFHYFHMWRSAWLIAIVAILGLMLFGVLALAFGDSETDWNAVKNTGPLILVLAFWLCVLAIAPRRGAGKQLAAQNYLREPVTYTFTAETISGVSPSAQWSIAWSVVKRIRETKSLFLLYHGQNIAVIVPKRFFRDSAEMERWRELVMASIHPKQIERPGLVARFC
jgi:hypothetical protein